MSWNYRVTRRYITNAEHYVYEIREVYYDDDGNMTATTVDPMGPMGETVRELKDDVDKMTRAFTLPVVDVDGDLPREI